MVYNSFVMGSPELFEKKFSILQEISSAIVVTDNITTIANLMLDLAMSYTNAEKGSLMLVNEKGELYILSARGISSNLVKTYRVNLGEGIAGIVAKNGQPVLVENIEDDERFKGETRDRYKTRSFVSCPIICKNRLLGVLNINDKKDNKPFTGDEFELLKITANQAAIALENAFLMNQLRDKAAELDEINKNLIQTDAETTEFLTRISHELRTPLNSIKGAVYYLRQSEEPSRNEQKEFYGIISDETVKLISTVDHLLDFLRLEDETRIIKYSIINLKDLLQEVAGSKLIKSHLTRKNIRLVFDIQPNVSDIVGDKNRTSQLFINLIEGLIFFLEKNDSITLKVHQPDIVTVETSISRPLPNDVVSSLAAAGSILQAGQSEGRIKIYLAQKVIESHRWQMSAENKNAHFSFSIKMPTSARQKIDTVINSTLDTFTEFISELLGVDICSIMLSDEFSGDLTIKSARGLDDTVIKRTRIRLGDSISGWVALEGKPLLIEDIETDDRFHRKNIAQYSSKSLISVPLKDHDKVIGVINMNNKKSLIPFTSQDLAVATVLSERVSCFIKKLYTSPYSEHDLKQFISSFDNLLDVEKKYHKKSSLFPELTAKLLDILKASDEEKMIALYIARVYDFGLVPIDDSIMNKKNLLPSETRSIKVHPYTTVSLLNNFEFSEDVKSVILHHHEKYDGSGYPDKLKGEDIPFISRVLAVVDSFCAMTGKRPYRKSLSKEEALDEIRKGSGSIYDPLVVGALRDVLESEQ